MPLENALSHTPLNASRLTSSRAKGPSASPMAAHLQWERAVFSPSAQRFLRRRASHTMVPTKEMANPASR